MSSCRGLMSCPSNEELVEDPKHKSDLQSRSLTRAKDKRSCVQTAVLIHHRTSLDVQNDPDATHTHLEQ